MIAEPSTSSRTNIDIAPQSGWTPSEIAALGVELHDLEEYSDLVASLTAYYQDSDAGPKVQLQQTVGLPAAEASQKSSAQERTDPARQEEKKKSRAAKRKDRKRRVTERWRLKEQEEAGDLNPS